MADLDDDIARIAALRGRKADDYAGKPTRPPLNRAMTQDVFLPVDRDLDAFDQLPERLRNWAHRWPNNTNARALLGLLQSADGDVDAVLAVLPSPKPEQRFARNRR